MPPLPDLTNPSPAIGFANQARTRLATRDGFEQAFGQYYEVLRSEPVEESERTLYLIHTL